MIGRRFLMRQLRCSELFNRDCGLGKRDVHLALKTPPGGSNGKKS